MFLRLLSGTRKRTANGTNILPPTIFCVTLACAMVNVTTQQAMRQQQRVWTRILGNPSCPRYRIGCALSGRSYPASQGSPPLRCDPVARLNHADALSSGYHNEHTLAPHHIRLKKTHQQKNHFLDNEQNRHQKKSKKRAFTQERQKNIENHFSTILNYWACKGRGPA